MAGALSLTEIVSILKAFFAEGRTSSDLVFEGIPDLDAKIQWVPELLRRKTLHDADYAVFGRFLEWDSAILDVGANYGYSAASIWASGAKAAVVSFEPILGYEPFLREIQRQRPGRLLYLMTGIGDSNGAAEFTTPIVNGVMAAALTTARTNPELELLASDIQLFAEMSTEEKEVHTLKFFQFTAPIARLDDCLAAHLQQLPSSKIVAIKIDTEGYEGEILSGARGTLAQHKPLVMAEHGHENSLATEVLFDLGYAHASRRENYLVITKERSQGTNAFYVHPDNIDGYLVSGLLLGARRPLVTASINCDAPIGSSAPAILQAPAAEYDAFMFQTCGVRNLHTRHPLGTSFALGTKYADRINALAHSPILELCKDLYDQLVFEGVPGAVVEFGVGEGSWLTTMLDHMDRTGEKRESWGFDSFEGLPDPDPAVDGPSRSPGQYATPIEVTRLVVKLDERPHAHLIKGWFQDGLASPEAQGIEHIAFARVDCDLYGSSVECLRFLDGRLSDGSILMFDDWPHLVGCGETKAFMEWVPTVPRYRYELVGFINWRIVFRVRHTTSQRNEAG